VERKFSALLRALHENGVEFILVGGLAGVLNGAPLNTFDVDIVHARTPENVARLQRVLESLDAVFRIQPDRKLRPDASHLNGPGHLNLVTSHGPLDVLGMIGSGQNYQDLLPHSADVDIGGGIRIRVLDLETLVAIKEDLGGDKDLAMLPILRQTLNETRKKEDR
jgi:predicted nucleotidyltransferase